MARESPPAGEGTRATGPGHLIHPPATVSPSEGPRVAYPKEPVIRTPLAVRLGHLRLELRPTIHEDVPVLSIDIFHAEQEDFECSCGTAPDRARDKAHLGGTFAPLDQAADLHLAAGGALAGLSALDTRLQYEKAAAIRARQIPG